MDLREQRLRREVFVIVAIKLMLIVGLWWGFFRGNQVAVDESVAARHLSASPATENKFKQGEPHAQ